MALPTPSQLDIHLEHAPVNNVLTSINLTSLKNSEINKSIDVNDSFYFLDRFEKNTHASLVSKHTHTSLATCFTKDSVVLWWSAIVTFASCNKKGRKTSFVSKNSQKKHLDLTSYYSFKTHHGFCKENLSVRPSVRLSVRPSVCPSVCPSVRPSIDTFIYPLSMYSLRIIIDIPITWKLYKTAKLSSTIALSFHKFALVLVLSPIFLAMVCLKRERHSKSHNFYHSKGHAISIISKACNFYHSKPAMRSSSPLRLELELKNPIKFIT